MVGVIDGVTVGVGVGDDEVGVGVTDDGVTVGVTVGVGVDDGHNPTKTTSRGALYPSTTICFAQRYSVDKGFIEDTLIVSVHPVHR